MPPKALVMTASTAATTSGPGDTSMDDGDSQVVTRERINGIGAAKIKLPSIKRFLGEKLKLKGFLTQMHFKVIQEGAKLATLLD